MIDFLKKYGGYNLKGLSLEEKKELEHLKIEIKKFKEIEEQENKEVVISEGSESGSASGSRKESIEENEKQNESQSQSKIKSQNQSQKESENDDDEVHN